MYQMICQIKFYFIPTFSLPDVPAWIPPAASSASMLDFGKCCNNNCDTETTQASYTCQYCCLPTKLHPRTNLLPKYLFVWESDFSNLSHGHINWMSILTVPDLKYGYYLSNLCLQTDALASINDKLTNTMLTLSLLPCGQWQCVSMC